MILQLYKSAYKWLRKPNAKPFVTDENAGSLVEAATTAMLHVGTAQVEGRRITAMVFDEHHDAPRFMAVSYGDGSFSFGADDNAKAMLDEHWPDWKEDQ